MSCTSVHSSLVASVAGTLLEHCVSVSGAWPPELCTGIYCTALACSRPLEPLALDPRVWRLAAGVGQVEFGFWRRPGFTMSKPPFGLGPMGVCLGQ